jgi:hypothetical protein
MDPSSGRHLTLLLARAVGKRRWTRQLIAFTKSRGSAAGEGDALLAAFLQHKLRNLQKSSSFSSSVSRRANAKRLHGARRTAFLQKLYGPKHLRRRVVKRPEALLYKPRPNLFRDTLCPRFKDNCLSIPKRLRQRDCQKLTWANFSFAKQPASVMNHLAELTALCAQRADLQLSFVDVDCDDVTPYILLAKLVPSLPPIISGGRISHEVGDVVTAVGLRGDLRIGTIKRARLGADYSVSAFKMASRTAPGAFGDEDHLLRPQYKEYVADRFVNTLNGWIGQHGLGLTLEAEGSFSRAIGEALDNAERHGDREEGAEGDWSIAAFSRLMFDATGAPLLRCSLGIVSIGATISESLNTAAESVRALLDRYATGHSGPMRSQRKAEMLRTVVALQDGITRDPKATEGRRGGFGLMELIDVVADLGDNGRDDSPATFTIVSGHACIRVTGKFGQGQRRTGPLRELWFNDANDPSQPPSKEHVMSLDHSFPGVILSACFTIDPAHLRKKLADEPDHG